MEAAQVTLQDGLFRFSVDLYQSVSSGSGNVFFSPHSVCSALMLACLGARGNTENQILTALGVLSIKENVHEIFKAVSDSLLVAPCSTSSGGIDLNLANKIFVATGMTMSDQFTKFAAEYYGSGVETMNFGSKPEECRTHINNWVEEQTKQKIMDLLTEGAITSQTNIVLTNAIYFKGKWEKPFKPEKTESKDFFTSSSETVKVEMMRANVEARYIEDDTLGVSSIALPYQGGNVNMIILLPKEIDSLARIEQTISLEKLAKLSRDVSGALKFKVELGIPKFSFTETYDLTAALPSLGITDLFDPTRADLTGLSADGKASFTDVVHKAFIEVNEEGTEAAAATAMMSRMMMMPLGDVTFVCDRPFLFLLVDVATNGVLFIGRYAQPNN